MTNTIDRLLCEADRRIRLARNMKSIPDAVSLLTLAAGLYQEAGYIHAAAETERVAAALRTRYKQTHLTEC